MHYRDIYISIIVFIIVVAICELLVILNQRKQLRTYENIRQKLYETSVKISKMNDEEEIYSTVLDTIIELVPNASNGSVLLYNHDDERFYYKVVRGYSDELKKLSMKKEEAYLYKMNEFKKSAIISNPEEFDRNNVRAETTNWLLGINALDISCTLSAPIYIDSMFIGLINVDSKKPDHTFTQKDLDLMEQIKCELELAIKNALAQNRLKYFANYDELTGLINRRLLKKEFYKEIEKIKVTNETFCLVMIDLDDFKSINDTYGHYFGDIVLKRFSLMLNHSVGKKDLVARFAGDEFVILFKDQNKSEAINKMSDIKEMVMSNGIGEVVLSFSFGVSEINSNENTNFENAMAMADVQMYKSKKVKVN